MASKVGDKRLTKEYAALAKAPPRASELYARLTHAAFIIARPLESDLRQCHFIIRGPPDSAFANGEYHGVLEFPPEYPFGPPAIRMHTPSGRFVPSQKSAYPSNARLTHAVCMASRSLSRTDSRRACQTSTRCDYSPLEADPTGHLESSVVDRDDVRLTPSRRSCDRLTGLLSFMLEDELTTGGMRTTDAEKRALSPQSHAFNLKNAKFKAIFPEYAEPTMRDLPNMGQTAEKKSVPASPSPPTSADDRPPPVALPPNRTPLLAAAALVTCAIVYAALR